MTGLGDRMPLSGLPVGDVELVARACDEVPPDQDRLGERLPADEQHPGRVGRGQGDLVAVTAEIAELAWAQNLAVAGFSGQASVVATPTGQDRPVPPRPQ